MAKKLVIVESPSKSKTIEKFLGSDYKVVSSVGHIRDLAIKGKFGLGVDLEDNYKPTYSTAKGKKKIIDELKKNVKDAQTVYLATDPDREGEAISWHLYDVLELEENAYERVVFNEITKNAIINSFKQPRKIDNDLVNSQEARRILDRIIGFRLSGLMRKKTDGSSAGRVQSVALKLIVDREKEIQAFIPEEYWKVTAFFNEFEAELFNYNNKELKITSEIEINDIMEKLTKSFTIASVDQKKRSKKSKMPFITSTLQQEASTKLGFNARKTMMIAQKLYEGIELETETVGLITYMRTDSNRLSKEFVGSTFKYIEAKYGRDYLGFAKSNKKAANVQDAHEAIRPTSINRDPISVKPFLSNDEFKLYRLIYYRSLASLMADAKTNNTTVILDNNNYQFKATGQTLIFDGYLKAYGDYEDTLNKMLPPFEDYKSNVIVANKIEPTQHFTMPPARFSEARLIKEMEELGIGRPSTYNKIIDTLKKRGYVTELEKRFHPSEIGIQITEKLQEHFSHIINVEYTADMEQKLDEIALGDTVWYEIIDVFYKEFDKALETANELMVKKEPEKTGEDCPQCSHPLVIRKGRYGEFTACSNFPSCKYIKTEPKEIIEVIPCPNCDGSIVEKPTKRGKIFYGCNNYPKCKTAYWDKPVGKKCPECKAELVEKNNKIKCSGCTYKED